MTKGTEHIIKCNDEKDLEERRIAAKKYAKDRGVFQRCEGNTIYLKYGDSMTFVIDDERLPPEAFDEDYQRIARDAALKMLE